MKLYKFGSSALLIWESTVKDNVLTITHGQFGGKRQEESYTYNNNAFALREEQSRVNSKIDRQGYSESIPTEVPDLPMLATLFSNQKLPPRVFVQPKLDGIRCIGTNSSMKTRRNLDITSMPHIQQALKKLPDGVVLDGELYCHGLPFEDHLSMIKRDVPSTQGLNTIKYHVFDIINDDDSEDRLSQLKKLSLPEKLVLVPTKLIDSSDIQKELELCIADKYEGLIVRLPHCKYGRNKRSQSLLKVKQLIHEEYKIIDITCSLSGREEGAAIFVLEKDGMQFKARPKFPLHQRNVIFEHKEDYIGYWTRIVFPNYTVRGVPSKPIAECLAPTMEGLN